MNKPPFARNAGLAASALLASSATLVCCVLPAVLVALGAGAALAGLVSAVPQLIWLSEHKPWVFTIAGILLGVSGIALWMGRRAPCPTHPNSRARAGACGGSAQCFMRLPSAVSYWGQRSHLCYLFSPRQPAAEETDLRRALRSERFALRQLISNAGFLCQAGSM